MKNAAGKGFAQRDPAQMPVKAHADFAPIEEKAKVVFARATAKIEDHKDPAKAAVAVKDPVHPEISK